jgi:hypothetical protein
MNDNNDYFTMYIDGDLSYVELIKLLASYV